MENYHNECPICGIDYDDLHDACAECGINPYSSRTKEAIRKRRQRRKKILRDTRNREYQQRLIESMRFFDTLEFGPES